MAKAPEHVRTSHKNKFLGALPNDPTQPRVSLKLSPGAVLSPPPAAGWYSTVTPSAWGMLGNDSAGDCVYASSYHSTQLIEKAAQGVETHFTTQQVLADYSAATGYNPRNPRSDVGDTLQNGLGWWRKNGCGGYKISAFAQIDQRNTTLLQQSVADFGVVYAALEVPSSAMDQFDRGQPWDVVSRSQIEGGHAVPIVGYDATYLYVVTWGAVQRVTYAFYAKYFDEAWVPISQDWITKSGKTLSGYDAAAANAEYQSLTGDASNPFVAVAPVDPPVTPPVDPPVNPPVTDVDATLAAALETWLSAKGFDQPHVHGH